VPQEAEEHPPHRAGRYKGKKEQRDESATIKVAKTSRKTKGLKTGRYNNRCKSR
jgi:hypothetical protein